MRRTIEKVQMRNEKCKIGEEKTGQNEGSDFWNLRLALTKQCVTPGHLTRPRILQRILFCIFHFSF